MTAVFMAIAGMIVFALGYRYYSKFIAQRIYRLDPNFKTPAHEFNDGVDFVPTKKEILWGHHFTSVAGAAPIVGPAIALYWGWVPAILWVLLGTIFAAGVHDFGAIVISNRHKGNSMGTLASKIIGARAKNLFLFIILILVLMVNAVFAWVIARLFISFLLKADWRYRIMATGDNHHHQILEQYQALMLIVHLNPLQLK